VVVEKGGEFIFLFFQYSIHSIINWGDFKARNSQLLGIRYTIEYIQYLRGAAAFWELRQSRVDRDGVGEAFTCEWNWLNKANLASNAFLDDNTSRIGDGKASRKLKEQQKQRSHGGSNPPKSYY
jgi:hypothetical protein